MTMTDISRATRRDILKLAGAAGAVSLMPEAARAATGPIVLGTWGGDTSRLLGGLVKQVKDRNDLDVVLDIGTPSTRKTKLLSQINRPRNSMDIPYLVDADMFLLTQMNALRTLDATQIPGYDTLLEDFRNPTSLPTMYSALVLVYSNSVQAPKSIADLWRKEYKVGIADLSYDKVIPMAAVAHGGSVSNFGPGYDALVALRQQGARVYASNEAVGNAFQSGEINAAIMWKGRALQWMDAGLPIAYSLPAEGAYPVSFDMAITRNSAFAKEAHLVLGAVLLPELQRAMALGIGQVPSIKNSGLAPEVEAKIGFTPQERARFIKPDHAYAASKSSEMIDFWNQKFKG